MKTHIITELKKENSTLLLVFVTVALGMGLDARGITRIKHCKPPTKLKICLQKSEESAELDISVLHCYISTKTTLLKTEKVSVKKYLNTPTILKNVEDSKSCSILGLKSPYTRGQQRTDRYSTFIIILVIMVIHHFTDLCFKNWNR